jgi:hypothetical protein
MKGIVLGLLAAAVIGLSATPASARRVRVYAAYPPVYSVYRVYPTTVYYPRRVYAPVYPVYPVVPVYPVYPAPIVYYY